MHSRGVRCPRSTAACAGDFRAAAPGATTSPAATISATVQETPAVLHKIMVPPGMSGTIESVESGDYTVEQTVAVLEDYKGETHELSMIQRWPVRIPRPYAAEAARRPAR